MKVIYTFYSTNDLTSEILDRFNKNYGSIYPNLVDPDKITVKIYKNGNNKIVWTGKVDKPLLPNLLCLEHHGEALYDSLPIEHSHIEIRYNTNSI